MPENRQEQRKVEVRMLDGSSLEGGAIGSNAAWLCSCDSKRPLIGSTFFNPRLVECTCGKVYRVHAVDGKQKGRLDYVEETDG